MHNIFHYVVLALGYETEAGKLGMCTAFDWHSTLEARTTVRPENGQRDARATALTEDWFWYYLF